MALGMSTRTEADHLTVVTLTGELDVYTVSEFRRMLDSAGTRSGTVVFDLTDVTLLDSSGIGALVSTLNSSRRTGGRIGLICPRDWLKRLFSITGLGDAFAFGDDLDHLRAAMAQAPAAPDDGSPPSSTSA